MPEDRNILIEDDQGNRYFPHTKASNVVGSNGKTAEDAINASDNALTAAQAAQDKANAALPINGSQAMTGRLTAPNATFTGNPIITNGTARLIFRDDGTSGTHSGNVWQVNTDSKWLLGMNKTNSTLELYDYASSTTALALSTTAAGVLRAFRKISVNKDKDSLSLVGAANSHVFMEFYNNGTNRSAWIGTGTAGTNLLTVRNEVANEHINLSTNGTGEARVNNQRIWDNSRLRLNNGALEFLDGSTWKGAGGIKRVQRGTLLAGSGEDIIVINTVVPDKTFTDISLYSGSGANATIELRNSTSIRIFAPTGYQVSWEVIEFY